MPRSPTFPTIHTDTNEIWVREYVAVQSFTAFGLYPAAHYRRHLHTLQTLLLLFKRVTSGSKESFVTRTSAGPVRFLLAHINYQNVTSALVSLYSSSPSRILYMALIKPGKSALGTRLTRRDPEIDHTIPYIGSNLETTHWWQRVVRNRLISSWFCVLRLDFASLKLLTSMQC